MKIQQVSDLHLEFKSADLTIPNAGTDVLILGGDICTAFQLKYEPEKPVAFFNRCADSFPHVIYIFGNHEHYHGDIDLDTDEIREALHGISNLHILDAESVEIDNVPFFGATLWTDANKRNPLTCETLRRGMNDFRLIKLRGNTFLPDHMVARHEQELAKLKAFAETCKTHDNKCIVATHHSPSLQSVHPRYDLDYHLNGGYHTDLHELIADNPHIALWTHGHTHDSFDRVEFDTRIVCNPAGYQQRAGIYENLHFDPAKLIDLGNPAQ